VFTKGLQNGATGNCPAGVVGESHVIRVHLAYPIDAQTAELIIPHDNCWESPSRSKKYLGIRQSRSRAAEQCRLCGRLNFWQLWQLGLEGGQDRER
jgi:hypothetical protein